MQIQPSAPQSKASSFLLSQRCVLASKMEVHRYVPAADLVDILVSSTALPFYLSIYLIDPLAG